MTARKRTRWTSTPNSLRKAKAFRVTLPERARAAQLAAAEAKHGGNISEATAAALIAYAEALGLVVAEDA